MPEIFGIIFAVLFPLIAQPQASRIPPPNSMTKMVVRLMGPGIKPGSYAALPRTIYRAGPHYARMESPPDARQRQQKLTIIAEPDAYSLNIIDKKGTHAIDQGGPNDLHLPIVLPFDPKHKLPHLDTLEFGEELDFFENLGATKKAGPIVNAQPTDAYVLQTPEGPATLVVKRDAETPIFISWPAKDGTYKYEYITYKEVPFEPALFGRPNGFQLREITPDTTHEEHP